MIKKGLECVRSFKEDSKEKTMDGCRRRDGPWRALFGGKQLQCILSIPSTSNYFYQVCLVKQNVNVYL